MIAYAAAGLRAGKPFAAGVMSGLLRVIKVEEVPAELKGWIGEALSSPATLLIGLRLLGGVCGNDQIDRDGMPEHPLWADEALR